MLTRMLVSVAALLLLSPLYILPGNAQPVRIDAIRLQTEEIDVFDLNNGVYACRSCRPPYQIMADGLDHAVDGRSSYDALNIRILDPHTVVRVAKKQGATVAEIVESISNDGHVLTVRAVMHIADSGIVTFSQQYERVRCGTPGSHALAGGWRKMNKRPADFAPGATPPR